MDNSVLSNHPGGKPPPLQWRAASRHPSNGGELGTFPPRPKSPFTTDGVTDSRPVAEQVPHLAEGWHAPACRGGLIPTAHIVGNTPRDENAPMPTAPGPRATCRVGGIRAPRKQSLRGWSARDSLMPTASGGGCRAKHDGGGGHATRSLGEGENTSN